jgi:hypothetical protein
VVDDEAAEQSPKRLRDAGERVGPGEVRRLQRSTRRVKERLEGAWQLERAQTVTKRSKEGGAATNEAGDDGDGEDGDGDGGGDDGGGGGSGRWWWSTRGSVHRLGGGRAAVVTGGDQRAS